MILNDFEKYTNDKKYDKIINNRIIASINKMKTNKKYLSKYNWVFLLQSIISTSCSDST